MKNITGSNKWYFKEHMFRWHSHLRHGTKILTIFCRSSSEEEGAFHFSAAPSALIVNKINRFLQNKVVKDSTKVISVAS